MAVGTVGGGARDVSHVLPSRFIFNFVISPLLIYLFISKTTSVHDITSTHTHTPSYALDKRRILAYIYLIMTLNDLKV